MRTAYLNYTRNLRELDGAFFRIVTIIYRCGYVCNEILGRILGSFHEGDCDLLSAYLLFALDGSNVRDAGPPNHDSNRIHVAWPLEVPLPTGTIHLANRVEIKKSLGYSEKGTLCEHSRNLVLFATSS